MGELVPYKKVITIELKDGTLLNTEKEPADFRKFMESASDIREIDGVRFNRYEFKKAYVREVGDVEGYILGLEKSLQRLVREREAQMFERVGRKFKTIEEVDTFLLTWRGKWKEK